MLVADICWLEFVSKIMGMCQLVSFKFVTICMLINENFYFDQRELFLAQIVLELLFILQFCPSTFDLWSQVPLKFCSVCCEMSVELLTGMPRATHELAFFRGI